MSRWPSLRREVPARRRRRRPGEFEYRAWLAIMTLLAVAGFWGTVMLALGCGRGGGPPPCFPQPAATSSGPGGAAPGPCEVRR